MKTKLLAVFLGFLILSVAASLSTLYAGDSCTTDTECVEQCEREGGENCDDVLGVLS